MKATIKKSNYALLLGLLLLSLTTFSCSDEEYQAPPRQTVYIPFQEPIPGGTKVGLIADGDTICVVKLFVTQNPLEVAKEQLGSSELAQEKPQGTQNLLDKQFEFRDGQVDHSEVFDPNGLITSVNFKTSRGTTAPEGMSAQMWHDFTIGFKINGEIKNQDVALAYTQYVKGSKRPDVTTVSRSMTVTTKEEKNGLTTTITVLGIGEIKVTTIDGETGKETVKSYPFTTEAKLTLTALVNPTEVEEFGTSCTKKPEGKTTATTTTSITTEYKSYLYDDGQKVDGSIVAEWENVEGFEVPQIILSAPEPLAGEVSVINDKEANMKLPYKVAFTTRGLDKEVTGDVKTSLDYRQVKKEEELTYKVSEYPTTNDLPQLRTDYLSVIIKRSDGKKDKWEGMVCESGTASGRKILGVGNPATTTGFKDTDFLQGQDITKDGNFTISTTKHVYRRETKYRGEVDDNLPSVSEILVTVRSIHYEDPETGWTWDKEYKESVEITSSDITPIAGKQELYREQGYDYKYLATHKITFSCKVNGVEFKSSVCENDLYQRLY